MLDSFVTTSAQLIGFPEDMFRFLFAFIVEVPISIICRYIPLSTDMKYLIYGIIGIFISFFVYSTMTYCVLITMIPVYLIMKYVPTRKGAYTCFGISLGYLLTIHIKRMIDNYLGYDLDFSSVQMVLTIKFTTFAFSVCNAQDKEYKCSEHTEKHKIYNYPSILQFFGYTFFFPAFFSGPSMEYTDFVSFIDMSMFKEFNNKLPPINMKAVGKVTLRLILIIVFHLISIKCSIFEFCEYYILGHKEESTCWFKLLMILLYVEFIKLRYYFVWEFGELLSILMGFGYSGMKDGETTWEGFKNVDIWKMETSDSVRQIVSNWNIQTERWLRYYVYERLNQNKTLAPYKSLLTNMVSAFWHGLYPGYYIAFGTMTLQQKFQYMLYTQVLPLLRNKYGEKSIPIYLYHTFNYIYTPFAQMYCFVSFVLLSFSATFTVYSYTYFIPHIIALSGWMYLSYFPVYKKPSRQETVETKPKEVSTGSPATKETTKSE
ncbi:hypothetical protein ENUP19_0163G0029 [Entamoeba nuttalli]|uniref:Membrane-bound O-acyltransferase (MBOAT ) family protein n=2 Tax=Entamoeba nuttalli TaxID=412467 RepID=K2GUP3_ENTNP|nr:membrane-bound O-acyltransferase (MBOAT) family protein [Entamoeba nuttalli P19]EKE38828.1 membrane-bound O-acyltransferase (MBOAT) family protein [Entamoeba nuttalli P19]|eukprot:XP_008858839.1 membrane-bound O-acyltransferase (MBOAT) family protein [Entamoeba nuttalli P19]